MTKTEHASYKRRFNAAFKKLLTANKIKNVNIELTENQNKELLVNAFVFNEIKKANNLLKTDIEQVYDIICEIPHNTVNPHKGCELKYTYVSSKAIYELTDSMRHYVRMMSFYNENIGGSCLNNIIMVG